MVQSYIALRPPSSSVITTSLQLSFRSFNKDGLIFLATQRESFRGDYLSISLVGGHVEVRYDLGSGPSVLTSNQQVSLGSWHSLVFKRYRQDGELQGNREQTVSGRSMGRNKSLNIVGAVYVGGHPDMAMARHMVGTDKGMQGCVRDIILENKKVVMGAGASLRTAGVVPCSNHPCGKRPCRNGGQCKVNKRTQKAACTCNHRFRGRRCQKRKKKKKNVIGSDKLFRTGIFGSKQIIIRKQTGKQISLNDLKRKRRNRKMKRKRKTKARTRTFKN